MCYQCYLQSPTKKGATIKWWANNRERSRTLRIYRVYGVTPEWYEETLAKQGGTCAYPKCGRTQEDSGIKLSIDHNHITGKPRGILCHYHNTALIEDSDFYAWAIEYLNQPYS